MKPIFHLYQCITRLHNNYGHKTKIIEWLKLLVLLDQYYRKKITKHIMNLASILPFNIIIVVVFFIEVIIKLTSSLLMTDMTLCSKSSILNIQQLLKSSE